MDNYITWIISHEGKTKFEYNYKGRTWIEDKQLTNEEVIEKYLNNQIKSNGRK